MLFLSVTEAGEAGALDSVSTTARNRRIFAWRKTGLDLRVLSGVRRLDGREEFSASCDTHVGRRWPRIPFTPRNKPLNRAFPSRGGTIGDDCCGPGCHRLVTSGRRTQHPGRLPRAGSVCWAPTSRRIDNIWSACPYFAHPLSSVTTRLSFVTARLWDVYTDW